MPERVVLLSWDTEFFGCPIARIDSADLTEELLDAALVECRTQRIVCAYALVPADTSAMVRAFEDRGFHFVDARLTLELDLGMTELAAPHASVRSALEEDVDALRSIAAVSHTDSRFYADPRFSRERCDELYRVWIEKSVRGGAQIVLTEGEPGHPAGYVTCHVDENIGSIGLIAVGADCQGRGVGGRLVGAALRWFAGAGLSSVRVVTQGRNIAAQRLYQRAGFRTRSLGLWFHRWFDESDPPRAASG